MKNNILPAIILIIALTMSFIIGMTGMVMIKKNMFMNFEHKLDNDIKALSESLKSYIEENSLDIRTPDVMSPENIGNTIQKIRESGREIPELIREKRQYNYNVDSYNTLRDTFINRIISRFLNIPERRKI
ncbi:MAG: hypothetical protein ACOCWO_03200 [Candidatus Muiribacteriaceae bacterium]